MPRRRQRIRKPTTPPPPPPIKTEKPSQTININAKESGQQESSQHINQSWENVMQRSNIVSNKYIVFYHHKSFTLFDNDNNNDNTFYENGFCDFY